MSSTDNHIRIFDTTLRDGEQSPGATMTLEEKVQIAELLDDMGIDIIEAGFPIASNGDFEAVSTIAERSKNSIIAGLARAIPEDIDRAGQAVRKAARGRIHTFVSTSPIHLQHQMKKTEDEVLEIIKKTVTQARNLIDDVEWSGMDATRTPIDFLCKCCEIAIKNGATTINIPDTVGYAIPREFNHLIKTLKEKVSGADKVIFSTHCHNDLGLAVANSLAGVEAGARQIECTINGLGERAGNAALEEVVMAISTRSDALPYSTKIDTKKILRASKLVSAITSFPVQYNKAIVGKNAFAHESGIHQDGMLKNSQTYEIMNPESIGLKESSLVMGKHSGRHAFREKLADLGYVLGDNAFQDAFERFKSLADKKKNVYDEDIMALVDDEIASSSDRLKFNSLVVHAGTEGPQSAELVIEVDGKLMKNKSTGDGPVDAIFNCIKVIFPHQATLPLYQVQAVTEGTDAQAEVSVKLEDKGVSSTGRSADTDTLVASARAYLNALNKLLIVKDRNI
ncbi:MAG: 2-isopropylmalate synthase [Hyphomicrobiales bacterium]|jgi:2-isopropylmalate synthase|nr:2-isopropylmalate synthase [Hyphomicrobiales bacterium]